MSLLFSFQAGAATLRCLATALAGMNYAMMRRWLSTDGGFQAEGGTVTPSTLKSIIDFMEENDVCPPLLRETAVVGSGDHPRHISHVGTALDGQCQHRVQGQRGFQGNRPGNGCPRPQLGQLLGHCCRAPQWPLLDCGQ